jgi:hypothetical protein
MRRHPVEQDGVVERRVAVRRHVGLLGLLRAADVRDVEPDAGTSDPIDWMLRALGIASMRSRVMIC